MISVMADYIDQVVRQSSVSHREERKTVASVSCSSCSSDSMDVVLDRLREVVVQHHSNVLDVFVRGNYLVLGMRRRLPPEYSSCQF